MTVLRECYKSAVPMEGPMLATVEVFVSMTPALTMLCSLHPELSGCITTLTVRSTGCKLL